MLRGRRTVRGRAPALGGETSAATSSSDGVIEEAIVLPVEGGSILADLTVPPNPVGTVVFAHGSGSGRRSPRNRAVAAELRAGRIATLLVDLLTAQEAEADAQDRSYRFDVARLTGRLVAALDVLVTHPETGRAPVGLFGSSTGGAAAVRAAVARPAIVRALVLRGARSDLADDAFDDLRAPTLFLVGELDPAIREMNEASRARTTAETRLEVVPGATHLFEEPGALNEVAYRSRWWFEKCFGSLPARGGTR